jgi:hypothetical protein
MDSIQPIERRSPWIPEPAPAETRDRSQTGRRERRPASRGASGAQPLGTSPREPDDPGEDGGSRRVDVRV